MFWKAKLEEKDILAVLKNIRDPRTDIDIVDAKWIENVLIQNGHVLVTLQVDPKHGAELETLRQKAENAIASIKGVKSVRVILTAENAPRPQTLEHKPPIKIGQESRQVAPHVKNIIAIASGKGGVGKSTVTANLARALASQGLKVGVMDADIYGPSMPMLFGLRDAKPGQEDDYLIPLEAEGIKIMSMGFLVDEESAMIWRGPMVQSAVHQLLRDVRWGPLDVLLIDMPPGTGDAQLTLAQKAPLRGAIIVSTPQDLALLDAVKGVHMFEKVNVPILGIIENMSVFCCPSCGTRTPIFGEHGARNRAKELNVPFLGEIPLDPNIRALSDQGRSVIANGNGETAPIFQQIATVVWHSLSSEKV